MLKAVRTDGCGYGSLIFLDLIFRNHCRREIVRVFIDHFQHCKERVAMFGGVWRSPVRRTGFWIVTGVKLNSSDSFLSLVHTPKPAGFVLMHLFIPRVAGLPDGIFPDGSY